MRPALDWRPVFGHKGHAARGSPAAALGGATGQEARLSDLTDLEIRERLARIDQLTADADLKRQEFQLGYRKFLASAVTAAAALLGAGAAIGAALVRLGGHP